MWTPDYEGQLQLLDRRDRRQGERYLRAGQARIERLRREPGELRVDAAVQGSRRDPYRLTLRFRAGGSPALESHCSCPLRTACKHVAAVLGLLQQQAAAASLSELPGATELPRSAGLGLALQLVDAQPCLRSLARIERSSGEVLWRPVNLGYFGADSGVSAELLEALQALPSDRDEQGPRLWLRGAAGAQLLQGLLQSGLCLDEQHRPLHAAPEELRMWLWRWAEQGDLRPDLDPGQGEAFWLQGPWCLRAGQLGHIDSGLPAGLAQQLHELPPLPVEQWQRAWPALLHELPTDFPPPPWPALESVEGQLPQPELMLQLARARDSQLSRGRARRVLIGRLRFHYGQASVCLGAGQRELRQGVDREGRAQPPGALLQAGSSVRRWTRKPRAELALCSDLLSHGARQDSGGLARTLGLDAEQAASQGIDRHAFLLNPTLDEAGLEDFCVRIVPQLRQRGWRIRYHGEFPLRLMDLQLQLRAEVQGTDAGVRVRLAAQLDAEAVDLWGALQRAREAGLKAGEHPQTLLPLPLADGRRIPISSAQWQQLERLLGGASAAGGALQWQWQPHQLGLLAELTPLLGEADVDWQAPESLRQLASQLEDQPVCSSVPAPSGLHTDLRPYQQQGLDWLGFLGRHGLGGILADDMGLGKTVQLLAHLLAEREAGRLSEPVLVVAPKSVLPNWQQEAARFAPELRTLALEGQARRRHFRQLAEYDLILTTYPLLSRDLAHWREQRLALAVFDESQMLKNPSTQAARAARALPAARRLALTGTPLENHLGELWAQVDLVAPGLLGARRDFERRHLGAQRDEAALQALRRRLRPFLLRRSKDQVAGDLPPKTIVTRRIALEGAQAEAYERLRASLSEQLQALVEAGRGLQGQRLRVLEALLRLRQLCCDPRLLPSEADVDGDADADPASRPRRPGAPVARSSAKLDYLLAMLDELLAEGRRILVFSQFTSMLALLAEALEKQRRPYLLLTGESSDRETPVRRFQARELPLFLISLRAGGFGLNLTAADTVIHYDPWWNPAVEAQATDRAHRIGQDKPVFVYRLIARDSIEERIVQLQDRKRELAEALLAEPSGGPGELSAEDLLGLLQ